MRYLLGVIFGCLLLALWPATVMESESGSTNVWRGVWNGHELTVAVISRDPGTRPEVDEDEPWWQWGNTSTDAYLFYWSEDQMVDLILDFSTEDGKPTARLYVPKTVEARQSVRIFEGHYSIDREINPDLIISPVDGDWLIDGKPNYDLTGLEANPTTGEFDWEIRVGAEAPGIPKWITRTVIRSDDPGVDFPHFGATVRMDDSVPFELSDPLFPTWPYLSAVDEEGHWGRIQPIFFSHVTRTIEQNWTGFHIAGMYQVNSITLPPRTNFESPFAFYRFDEEAGRYANMVIRSDIWPDGDPNGPLPHYAQRTSVRMTWTGEQPELWRYSLTVGGNHPHEDEVEIGDTTVTAVAYEDYPEWIASKPWSAVTFVEATDGETGSEGIYDFSVEDNYPVTEWINGLRMEPPSIDKKDEDEERESQEAMPTLHQLEREPHATLHSPYLEFPAIHPLRLAEGFRGEYSLAYNQEPQLYFSPIDNRAHLLYAHEGIWNLGDGKVLRVRNSDGGPYIDVWWLERVPTSESTIIDGVSIAAPGRIEAGLFALDNFVLYSSDSRVELRELAAVPENDLLEVPTDESSWREFLASAEVAGHQERDPNELASWIQEIPGESLQLRRAKATEVRITDNGFRFVLELRHGFQVEGLDFPGLSDLEPGSYIVAYDGEFSVTPLTPPSITATISGSAPVALEAEPVVISLKNSGLQDLQDATLELLATSGADHEVTITSSSIDVLAESTIAETVQWAAPAAGKWTVTPVITTAAGTEMELDPTTIEVRSPKPIDSGSLIAISTGTLTRLVSVLGLLTFAVVAGVAWWSQWNPLDPEGNGHDR